MDHATLGVALGAAAGAGGGAIAGGAVLCLKRARLRWLIREVELAERELEQLQREVHGDVPLPPAA